MKRGRGNVNYHVGTSLGHKFDGVMMIGPPGPQCRIVPCVLTYGYAQGVVFEFHHGVSHAWFEVPGFIKDIVGGQQRFVMAEKELALIYQKGRVVDTLSCRLMV